MAESESESGSVIQLKCSCNEYPWGKIGRQSLAARLCEKTNPEFQVDESKPYAEMWMGTYPELPSYSLKTGEDLQEILNKNKDKLIGKTVVDKFGANLPFLPKILSIAKALPLQIHPNRELSEKLHKEDPEKYTDPNHKPEIAVALGKFEAFIGYKPLKDIEELTKLDCLEQFVPRSGSGSQQFDNETLREVCRSMLKAPEDTVAAAVKGLLSTPVERYGKQAYILDLTRRLEEQYGRHDNGNLVALVCMNYMVLEAGSVVYIPADGIHAYLSGDIVECMARSNNVINTGFCPKPDRDSVDLFTDALTFKQHDPSEPMLKREATDKSGNGKTIEFRPPMSEFNILVTELSPGETETVKPILGPSIMVATTGYGNLTAEGREYPLGEGYIYFIGQGVPVEINARDKLAVYRAYAE
ncbi:phosphomannose isomerase type I [Capronia epimyces CBS 606.96]|uniref:Mannose-6-phosphate isomerase n=1 Tax=Capronia epimyces CBS 606.96 TaxID=1182542 RepID=W9YH01_9EURO|nr:phosphomannose isomerase type I [Capronia epimyces CBS 606.96]EXJ92177.1 phosphomannose isomerase type I [Capronia epimyces CBS 606.96]